MKPVWGIKIRGELTHLGISRTRKEAIAYALDNLVAWNWRGTWEQAKREYGFRVVRVEVKEVKP